MEPLGVDSLQATKDTVVIVQAQSNHWLDWISLLVSVLIAGFTGGYLYYTTKIFRRTAEQADAAQESAQASQEAAKTSQQSLQEQRRLNDAQIEALEQAGIREAHPLLWANIDLRTESSGRWVEVQLQNQSNLPALEVEFFIVCRFKEKYCSWEELVSRTDDVVPDYFQDDAPDTYCFFTRVQIDAVESGTKPTARIQFPAPPMDVQLLLQYRDIHGDNYARYFNGQPFHDEDADALNIESIRSYGNKATVPHSVTKYERMISITPRGYTNWRNAIVRKSDRPVEDISETAAEYCCMPDNLIQKVGQMNMDLRCSIDTGTFPPLKAKVEDAGLFTHTISAPIQR